MNNQKETEPLDSPSKLNHRIRRNAGNENTHSSVNTLEQERENKENDFREDILPGVLRLRHWQLRPILRPRGLGRSTSSASLVGYNDIAGMEMMKNFLILSH